MSHVPPPNDVTLCQKEAADPNLSIWVQANAGAGKTKVLIDRLARLLLNGTAPDKILGLTFTKAAAAEMKIRLFDQLKTWSALPHSDLVEDIAELEGVLPNAVDASTINIARTRLTEVLETQGGLRIETIHSFAQKLLTRFPLEARLPSNPHIIEGSEEENIWNKAVDAALLALAKDKPAILEQIVEISDIGYIAEQIQKHRGRLQNVLKSAEGDVDARIEDLRLSLKAPDESADEIMQNGLYGPAMPIAAIERIIHKIETLGATSGKTVLAQFYNILKPTLTASAPIDRWDKYKKLATRRKQVCKKDMAEEPDFALFRIAEPDFGEEILRIKSLAEALTTRQIFEKTAAIYHFADVILQKYTIEKQNIGALDNSDLIDKTLELFTEISSADWILYKLDSQLEHILIDEAQDTSPRQWALLRCLLDELHANPSASGRVRTQFTVGDEKQSIYGFQGADPATFHAEESAFHADGQTDARNDRRRILFDTSFRSSPQILDFVDTVLGIRATQDNDVSASHEDPPIHANLSSHRAFRTLATGSVELWPTLPADETDGDGAGNAWKPSANVNYHATIEGRLAARVATHIEQLLTTGAAIEDKNTRTLRPCEPRDILILVEKRHPLMAPLVNALKRRNIPVAGVDRISLQDDIGVQDCLNLIRFTLQPHDDLTLAEVLRGPFIGLTNDDVHLFPLAYGRKGSLWTALRDAVDISYKPAKHILENCLARAHNGPFAFLHWALNDLRGWDQLIARLGPPCRDAINCLLDKALSYETDNVASLQGFIIDRDTDTSDIKRVAASDVNYVRIMSVHGAKGLEAPIVLLPQPPRYRRPQAGSFKTYDGFPIWTVSEEVALCDIAQAAIANQKQADLDENFRLFYVAMTRARDHLYMFGGERKKDDAVANTSWDHLAREAMAALGAMPNDDGILHYGTAPEKLGPDVAFTPKLPDLSLPNWLLERPNNGTNAAFTTGQKLSVRPSQKDHGAAIIRPFQSAGNAGAARGTLIHALFEHLIPIAADSRAKFGARFIRAEQDIPDEIGQAALRMVLETLSKPEFCDLFDPQSGQSEVPIFGQIPHLPDMPPINGRIDRLVYLEDRLVILDYKSDKSPPKTAEDTPIGYGRQLAFYKMLLERAHPNIQIDAAILWTQSGELMLLPDTYLQTLIEISV